MAHDDDTPRQLRHFAGQIAHELNNALTGVLGLAEVLQHRTDLDADVRSQIDSIARHGTRLKRLGAKLIEISRMRPEAGFEVPDLREWLEREESHRNPQRPLPGGPPAPKLGGAVLLVEDEEVVREVLTWQLRDMGLRVESSASAEEAEALLSAGARFDLAIVDYILPGMSGLDFATYLRDVRPEVPVLMLSGRSESPAAAPGVFQAWLVKPVDPDDLRRAVGEQLRRP